MERFIRIVLAVLVSAVCLCSCGRDGKVIPRSKLSRIYAEMFLADQWLNDNPGLRKTADTTRFYETIFRKFGYGFEDYDASVNYYLNHPEKYKKIIERTQDKLRKTQKSLESFEKALERQNQIQSRSTPSWPGLHGGIPWHSGTVPWPSGRDRIPFRETPFTGTPSGGILSVSNLPAWNLPGLAD